MQIEEHFKDINFQEESLNILNDINEDLSMINSDFSFCFNQTTKMLVGIYLSLKNYSYCVSPERVQIIRKDNNFSCNVIGSKGCNSFSFYQSFVFDEILFKKLNETVHSLSLKDITINMNSIFSLSENFSNSMNNDEKFYNVRNMSHQFKSFKQFFLSIQAKELFPYYKNQALDFSYHNKNNNLIFIDSSIKYQKLKDSLDIINLSLDIDTNPMKKFLENRANLENIGFIN